MEMKTAKNAPYPVEVIKDQTYYWCSCGLSENQPFCDGSHQRTDLFPMNLWHQKVKQYISVVVNNQRLDHCVMELTTHCEGG